MMHRSPKRDPFSACPSPRKRPRQSLHRLRSFRRTLALSLSLRASGLPLPVGNVSERRSAVLFTRRARAKRGRMEHATPRRVVDSYLQPIGPSLHSAEVTLCTRQTSRGQAPGNS